MQMKPAPRAHHQCPGKPGTEFKKSGPLFSLGTQQRRPTEFHAASSADIISCLSGLPRDHPKAQLHLPPCMSCVSTHSQDRPCVGEVAYLLPATSSCRESAHCPGTPAGYHICCPASSRGTQPSASHASHLSPTRPPTFPPDASSQLRPNISELQSSSYLDSSSAQQ